MVGRRFRILLELCFVLLLSMEFMLASGKCPPEFSNLCKCGYVPYGPGKKPKYVTNCTNTGFENAFMLRKLPEETEVLIFVGNEVKDLPLNIFGQEVVYENLHTIDLSNNHIQSIKGRTFHNVANVTKLILNDNDLYIVSKDHHPRMFSNFVNLRELHLKNAFTEKVKASDYLNNLAQIFGNSSLNNLQILNLENNEITQVSYREFCSLPALERLYLGNNRLRDINLNYKCLKYLKELDVGNNLIQYLSDSALKNLGTIKHLKLNLSSNPFKCDCNFVSTYEWIFNTTFTLGNKDLLYCWDGSPALIGKLLSNVQSSELQCPESHSHSPASFIILTIGFICLIILLTVLIHKNKLIIGLYLRRILQPLRSKFHYVSLDRRDPSMEV
ncbi:phospholipase A2 inhibitor-like [Uloborus diversus]|uniref:phospholipase A2 inhibitor-like n=1 Tax=Uloborus diversus TaxID=327109 RepID=UPI002409AD34|nr:phospholipase A2 inhibitor-like [Uloborus diversus]